MNQESKEDRIDLGNIICPHCGVVIHLFTESSEEGDGFIDHDTRTSEEEWYWPEGTVYLARVLL